MRTWIRYFEEAPTATIRVPSFNALLARAITNCGEEENRRQREKMPLRKQFYEKMGRDGFPKEFVDESVERLTACLDRVEMACLQTGPFLLGSRLTLADITLLPSLVRMDDLGMAHFWQDKPGVSRWYSVMIEQDAFNITYVPGRIRRLITRICPDRFLLGQFTRC
jgi:glutathione S-transferase